MSAPKFPAIQSFPIDLITLLHSDRPNLHRNPVHGLHALGDKLIQSLAGFSKMVGFAVVVVV